MNIVAFLGIGIELPARTGFGLFSRKKSEDFSIFGRCTILGAAVDADDDVDTRPAALFHSRQEPVYTGVSFLGAVRRR